MAHARSRGRGRDRCLDAGSIGRAQVSRLLRTPTSMGSTATRQTCGAGIVMAPRSHHAPWSAERGHALAANESNRGGENQNGLSTGAVGAARAASPRGDRVRAPVKEIRSARATGATGGRDERNDVCVHDPRELRIREREHETRKPRAVPGSRPGKSPEPVPGTTRNITRAPGLQPDPAGKREKRIGSDPCALSPPCPAHVQANEETLT